MPSLQIFNHKQDKYKDLPITRNIKTAIQPVNIEILANTLMKDILRIVLIIANMIKRGSGNATKNLRDGAEDCWTILEISETFLVVVVEGSMVVIELFVVVVIELVVVVIIELFVVVVIELFVVVIGDVDGFVVESVEMVGITVDALLAVVGVIGTAVVLFPVVNGTTEVLEIKLFISRSNNWRTCLLCWRYKSEAFTSVLRAITPWQIGYAFPVELNGMELSQYIKGNKECIVFPMKIK